ncbi:acetyl-CoA carboxylase biotin carboxyl carrier protein [Burkholderia sp. MR1-5-21]
MNSDLIDRLIDLFESKSLLEIRYDYEGTSIRLSRSAPGTVATDHDMHGPADTPVSGSQSNSSDGTTRTESIESGMAGTFYRGQSPDAPPFVNVGDIVSEGQQVGIVEAMKMLNVVEADRSGRIAAIRVSDGAAVRSGTVLFELEMNGDAHV